MFDFGRSYYVPGNNATHELDVARWALGVHYPGKTSTIEENIEAFSMMFDKNMTLKMGWGKTVVSVSIK